MGDSFRHSFFRRPTLAGVTVGELTPSKHNSVWLRGEAQPVHRHTDILLSHDARVDGFWPPGIRLSQGLLSTPNFCAGCLRPAQQQLVPGCMVSPRDGFTVSTGLYPPNTPPPDMS